MGTPSQARGAPWHPSVPPPDTGCQGWPTWRRRCGQAGWEEGRRGREAGRKVCWAAEAGTPAGDARRPQRPQLARESCSPWVSGDLALPAGEPLRPQPRAPRPPTRPSRVESAGPGWALGGDERTSFPAPFCPEKSEPGVLFA